MKWDPGLKVSRKDTQGLDSEIVQAIFRADVRNLPSYTGLANPQGGYTLIRIDNVIKFVMPNGAQRKAFARQLQERVAQEEFSAYLAGIRKRYDVSVKDLNSDR